MAINKIVKNSITGDAIDATKIADDAVSEEHLDVTAITGNTELSATAADDDVLLIFDTSSSSIKKIQSSNVGITPPTFTSVSPTNLLTGDGTGNHTIIVNGTKFDSSATFKLRTDGGTDISMDTVTRNSAIKLTGVVAKSTANLTNANEPFDVVVTNGNGLQVVATNQINVDASPVYTTSAGTLGTVTGGSAISTIDIVAADPESTANVTFEIQSGSIPAGLSSATVNENGVSKFRITGTPTNPVANTTSNFVLRAVDNASNTTSRAFSITVNRAFTSTSFTSSGTFAVPSGTSSVDVLVVAAGAGGGNDHGGGGGAGGLIFMPGTPVSPGGTVAVTVGCGGAVGQPGGSKRGASGQDSVFGDSPSPGTTETLRAKGGGGGGGGNSDYNGNSGGSGGGGSGHGQNSTGTTNTGGTGNQPTQSGNSGAYGFGSNGGQGISPPDGNQLFSGGGGGAGAVGSPGNPGGVGGVGKAYTIADGTTSVYYAGGGGGSYWNSAYTLQPGGQGGGGAGIGPGVPGQNGQANKGGGGGGGPSGGNGGKGIVVVRY